jgi:hypothetical protein
MGSGPEWIEASSSENNRLGNREAHHVGVSPPKDRSGTKGAVGEGQGGGEKGGVGVKESAAGFSAFKSGEESLVNGKVAARPPNGFARPIRNEEFEAVAESILLAHGRTNCHWAIGKREAQLHDLAYGHSAWQHGCDPGFANVHGTAFQQTASAGTDSDLGFNFKPRLPSVVSSRSQPFRRNVSISLQFRSSPLSARALDTPSWCVRTMAGSAWGVPVSSSR